MIAGTGIDIIEVARVAEKIEKNNGFKERVFSRSEINYCESNADPMQHFAARFAAKEAFLKATGKGLILGFDLNDVEVLHDDEGRPHIELHGGFKLVATERAWTHIHISLSHVKDMACAIVIIEQ